jgi:16S rRNA (guanine1207-N2)-methyltransferase
LPRRCGACRPAGLIVVAGGKEDGIQSLRKRIDQARPDGGDHTMPKYHGVAIWFARPAGCGGGGCRLSKPMPVTVDGRFTAAPGMFSHDRIDDGLRAARQPHARPISTATPPISAQGWGYLSVRLASRRHGEGRRPLRGGLRGAGSAKENIARELPERQCPLLLARSDVPSHPRRNYDLIVMNPPFHEGHAADHGTGQGMIRMAASSLKAAAA